MSHLSKLFRGVCLVGGLLIVGLPGAKAVPLYPGDIIVGQDGPDGFNRIVIKADPATGDRALASRESVLGTGPGFSSMLGLALDQTGNILIVDPLARRITKVDPATGDRSEFSGISVGTGPSLLGAIDLVVGPNGEAYVTDTDGDAVLRIDPATGNRTVFSGPSVGSGATLVTPTGLCLTAAGDLYLFNSSSIHPAVIFVDGTTADRTVISDASIGTGPALFGGLNDVTVLPGGFLAVSQGGLIDLVEIATGNRSILSGPSNGTGPLMPLIRFLVTAPDGSLIASGNQSVFRVDPVTGDRTILTDYFNGTGDYVGGRYGEAVVFVPEPASLAITAIGSAMLLGRALARRRRR